MDIRLSISGVPREIRPLVDRVNEALDRMEAGFRQQKEFTADVAHELRTPLAVLRARLEAELPEDVQARFVSDLDGINRLIGQMLKASQLDAMSLQSGDMADLLPVARRVVSDLALLAIGQGRQVELVAGPEAVKVHGLEEALYQALRNLVENALRHTAEETVVSVIVSNDEGPVIRVCDHGPGIDEAQTERLFQRFWRKDRSSDSGAGLGLSIVAKIMGLHGGRVTAENREGGGACFSLVFPAGRL